MELVTLGKEQGPQGNSTGIEAIFLHPDNVGIQMAFLGTETRFRGTVLRVHSSKRWPTS